MFQPRQLLIVALAILLFSCNSTDKQKEQSTSPRFTQDTITTISKETEVNSDTTVIVAKKPVAFKGSSTQKTVIADSNPQIQTSLESDFKSIEQSFQNFEVNPNFDTIIFCKEGM